METADLQVKIPDSRLKKIKEKFGKVPKHIWFLSAFLIITLIALAILYPALLSELAKKSLEPFSQTQEENKEDIVVPEKPYVIPLAQGRRIYNISGGTKGGPQMTQAVIDPLDPKPSQIQTLTLKANNLKPIIEIKATVITDNEESVNSLKLIQGSNTDGVWQGSWRIKDEYDYNYQIELVAKNNEEIESIVTLTFR